MKLSEQKSKIVGIMAGEVAINTIRPDLPPLRVKFALLADEGPIGFSEIGNGGGIGSWSEKTTKALQALIDALEEDGLRMLFKGEPQATETPQTEGKPEPPQF